MELVTIPGFDGRYSITRTGKVWSHSVNRWLAQFLFPNGYMRVGLVKDGEQKLHLVHRLVATTYIEKPFEKAIVNHKNGIKTDNRVENLEWCSYSHNNRHAFVNGLNVPRRGGKSHASKLSIKEVDRIRNLLREKELSQSQIAKLFGVSRGCIQGIKEGKSW